MKRIALILVLALCITITFSLSSPWYSPVPDSTKGVVFPASLVMIEDEAFAGTALESVGLPGTVTMIGERAFANNRGLKVILIPESVSYIGETAFDGVSGLLIRGAEDSYAAHWAKTHDFAFVSAEASPPGAERTGKLLGNILSFLPLLCLFPADVLRLRRKTADTLRSMRPQDRPELHPIDYRFP